MQKPKRIAEFLVKTCWIPSQSGCVHPSTVVCAMGWKWKEKGFGTPEVSKCRFFFWKTYTVYDEVCMGNKGCSLICALERERYFRTNFDYISMNAIVVILKIVQTKMLRLLRTLMSSLQKIPLLSYK